MNLVQLKALTNPPASITPDVPVAANDTLEAYQKNEGGGINLYLATDDCTEFDASGLWVIDKTLFGLS